MNQDTAERDARNKLVGYCDQCGVWYRCTNDERSCATCGGRPSHKIGFQLTTQRTFNPDAKKLSKAAQKRMGIGA